MRKSLYAQPMEKEMEGENMQKKVLPACPECDKLAKVSEDSQKIGEFIDWLHSQEIELAKWEDDELFTIHESIEKLLAKYFEIDLVKVENERQALLKAMRN